MRPAGRVCETLCRVGDHLRASCDHARHHLERHVGRQSVDVRRAPDVVSVRRHEGKVLLRQVPVCQRRLVVDAELLPPVTRKELEPVSPPLLERQAAPAQLQVAVEGGHELLDVRLQLLTKLERHRTPRRDQRKALRLRDRLSDARHEKVAVPHERANVGVFPRLAPASALLACARCRGSRARLAHGPLPLCFAASQHRAPRCFVALQVKARPWEYTLPPVLRSRSSGAARGRCPRRARIS